MKHNVKQHHIVYLISAKWAKMSQFPAHIVADGCIKGQWLYILALGCLPWCHRRLILPNNAQDTIYISALCHQIPNFLLLAPLLWYFLLVLSNSNQRFVSVINPCNIDKNYHIETTNNLCFQIWHEVQCETTSYCLLD